LIRVVRLVYYRIGHARAKSNGVAGGLNQVAALILRLLAFPILLFALASCGGGKGVENTNPAKTSAVQPSEAFTRRQCVNLNTATAEELERLPGFGEVTARKIVEYREQNGPFRRPEEIIIIEGFSERKYRLIADLVCVN
jgi:competence ComEA-like helix-hairpin-helix protein